MSGGQQHRQIQGKGYQSLGLGMNKESLVSEQLGSARSMMTVLAMIAEGMFKACK